MRRSWLFATGQKRSKQSFPQCSLYAFGIGSAAIENWLLIFFLPIIRTAKLLIAQMHITAHIGIAVPLLKILTSAVDIAPIPNCIAPINAEAVPAFFVKGANESAEELGNANP